MFERRAGSTLAQGSSMTPQEDSGQTYPICPLQDICHPGILDGVGTKLDGPYTRIVFGAITAIHACPSWYGSQLPRYVGDPATSVTAAGGNSIKVYG